MIARTLTLLLAIQVTQAVHMRSLIQVVNWSSKTTNVTTNATATANVTATIDSQKKANATTSAQVAANLTKAANGTANVTSNATSYAAIRAKANAIANVSINANASSGKNASSNSTKNTKAFAATNASSKATVNATANMTSKVSANATTKATVNATANMTSNVSTNATTSQKTMLQMWNQARATTLETKIGVIDEKITQCFIQAASNKSMNYTRNSTTNDYPKMATLCKVEKSELMAVHGEVTKELLNYIELIKSGSDTFNQRNIEANGLKPSQMEPFTLATKLVQVLEQSEMRHLGRAKPEAAFEKLTEEMSNILEWYEKHEKNSNVKVQED